MTRFPKINTLREGAKAHFPSMEWSYCQLTLQGTNRSKYVFYSSTLTLENTAHTPEVLTVLFIWETQME